MSVTTSEVVALDVDFDAVVPCEGLQHGAPPPATHRVTWFSSCCSLRSHWTLCPTCVEDFTQHWRDLVIAARGLRVRHTPCGRLSSPRPGDVAFHLLGGAA